MRGGPCAIVAKCTGGAEDGAEAGGGGTESGSIQLAEEPEGVRRVAADAGESGEDGVVRYDGGARRGAEEREGVGDGDEAGVEGEQLVNEEGGRRGRGGWRGDNEQRVQLARAAEDGAVRGMGSKQRRGRRGKRRLHRVQAEVRRVRHWSGTSSGGAACFIS